MRDSLMLKNMCKMASMRRYEGGKRVMSDIIILQSMRGMRSMRSM